uniref:Large ribosomal subunit protein bL32m n=1 Tax=Globisporangium ultimum (strain ATCC 200006 / CBS 805.95 / DAOM BR144) TaxID=431595 RepID=K3WUI2_GLOUD
MTMMMQRMIQSARSYLFPETALATSLLAPVVINGAATAPASASNPLNEALWLAAPKSKVTPRVKKIRNNALQKRLKNIVHFQDCPLCGDKKLRHRLCMTCFKKGKYFV